MTQRGCRLATFFFGWYATKEYFFCRFLEIVVALSHERKNQAVCIVILHRRNTQKVSGGAL